MKRSKDVVNARRRELLEIIRKTGDVRVPDIAEHLGVSEVTVRRDLQYLEDHKSIDRYYGGARVREEREKVRRDDVVVCRENIARYAAGLVEDGDTIFINTSSNALMIMKYITAKDVTVITNNGNAITSPKSHTVKVMLTGGELYNIKGTLVGEFAIANINKVAARKAFLGCAGFSLENGMTTEIQNEVALNQAMIQRVTDRAYILADHRKFGKNKSFVSCGIDMIKNLITDDETDTDMVRRLRELGINVTRVSHEDGNPEVVP